MPSKALGQRALGLYGAMIIDPAQASDELKVDHEYTLMLQEWLMREGEREGADLVVEPQLPARVSPRV